MTLADLFTGAMLCAVLALLGAMVCAWRGQHRWEANLHKLAVGLAVVATVGVVVDLVRRML